MTVEFRPSHPFLPMTPRDMIEFIDVHFGSHKFAHSDGTPLPAEDQWFTLSIHDLMSAFRWAGWYDDRILGEIEYQSWGLAPHPSKSKGETE